jgi:predicted adenine nucleotide alpha hydrolase (AANH) superfamily ATPase
MKVLLHICCAPCAIFPFEQLHADGADVMGFFYRHNIHPFQECRRREEALEAYAENQGLKLIISPGYDLEGFLRSVVFREANRCQVCYHDRLHATALLARRGKFDAFTSTLLYSKHQKHGVIRAIAEDVAKQTGVSFLYEDYRTGWKYGIETSRRLKMYRQAYCGCVYSEKERYFRERSPSDAATPTSVVQT